MKNKVKFIKKVRFKIEGAKVFEYNEDALKNELRDRFAQYLIKYSAKKMDSGEIVTFAETIEYIAQIFENALGAKLSERELEKIDFMQTKFSFLQYRGSNVDNFIHRVAYTLIGLSSGNKKLVQQYISPTYFFDSNLSVKTDRCLDHNQAKSLCEDVANLTRECVKEFLYEIKNSGKIMTSVELEEHNNALAAANAEEENNYSDDEFETYSDDGKTSLIDASKNNQGKQENDASLSIEHDITKEENSNSSEIKAEYVSKPNLVLEFILSWIYVLPLWLKDQILDSAPIKSLVESIEQTSAMYDKKSLSDIFSISRTFESKDNLQNEAEDNRQEKVQLYDLKPADSIDMTMIWKEPSVTGWILPIIGMDSGAMFVGDTAFNGLPGLNGYGIDLF
jgi:hypothetical protein